MVHRLAGARVDRADDSRRVPRGLRSRPLPIPRTQPGRRARRRPVRAPDGGRRARVRRDPPRRHRARMGADPDRARVLQRRGRRADRRHVLGEPRPAGRGGSRHAGRVSDRAIPGDHAAAARSRDGGCGGDRLPLLVHVVRDRADSRWPAVRDDRGGDLQPGGSPVRPAGRRRPLARAARVRRRGGVGRNAVGAETRRRPVRFGRSARPSAGYERRATG